MAVFAAVRRRKDAGRICRAHIVHGAGLACASVVVNYNLRGGKGAARGADMTRTLRQKFQLWPPPCVRVASVARLATSQLDRRRFVGGIASAALAGCASGSGARRGDPEHRESSDEAEVTPGEDLMQEHGVLERVLLVYEEATRRIEANEAVDLALIGNGAGIVRRFIEDYHEKSEEQYVFPRLEAAGRETVLVAVLRQQHDRGRQLTDEVLRQVNGGDRAGLIKTLREFTRMYRPHAAREETVLFPAFRATVGRSAYHELGERFEEEEHKRFGEHGFEDVVAEVARLEAAFGLDNLANFTPP